MDVGEIEYGEQYSQQGGEEWPVDWVSPQTQCYKCGGYGHLSRDCATPEKGKGKGFEKGGYRM